MPQPPRVISFTRAGSISVELYLCNQFLETTMDVCKVNQYIDVIRKGETQRPKNSLSMFCTLYTYPGYLQSLGFMGLPSAHSIPWFSSVFLKKKQLMIICVTCNKNFNEDSFIPFPIMNFLPFPLKIRLEFSELCCMIGSKNPK